MGHSPTPWIAELGTVLWAGFVWRPCLIVGETPKRYRIKSVNGEKLRLAGRRRFISGDQTALVPKIAVRAALAAARRPT